MYWSSQSPALPWLWGGFASSLVQFVTTSVALAELWVLLLFLASILVDCEETFLSDGVKGLQDTNQKLLGSLL